MQRDFFRAIRLAAALALPLAAVCAQADAPKPSTAPAKAAVAKTAGTHKVAAHAKKKIAAKAATEPAKPQEPAVAAAPIKPEEPPAPHWLANDKPSPATVQWDSQGLSVVASNASLAQILDDVSTATGARIEGFSNDRRIFGNFGPGRAADVIAQLLEGSGYNVLLFGDQGQGTPRRVVLTSRNGDKATDKAAAGNAPPSDDDDDEPAAQEPPTNQRTPLQMRQEMMERQMQMRRGDANTNPSGIPNMPQPQN